MEVKRYAPSVSDMEKPDFIAARMREVFDAVPAIVGFAFDAELLTIEVELERWPGHTWSDEAYADVEAQITNVALEAIAEDPRGLEALRGRTFARTLQ
jgi:hypothetical protein